MHYIILDLEATCWEKDTNRKDQETIEIGAVKLNDSLQQVDEFDLFVKPIINPQLSAFCIGLTKINQQDVDLADPFDIAFPKFIKWIGEGYTTASWGDYDLEQLQLDCKRHKLKLPGRFIKKHLNLKKYLLRKKE